MSAKIYPLDDLAVVRFSGPDSRQFLQSQLTADMDELRGNEAIFACVCNPAGRVLGLFLICESGDHEFHALCARSLADHLLTHLRRFVLRARLEMDVRSELVVAGLSEPVGQTAGAIRFNGPAGSYGVFSQFEVAEAACSQGDAADWRMAELVHGVHWLDERTSAKFLPQMLGYERVGALSFSKGCYPGQEVIARTRHLGKLKRHPLACQLDQHVHLDSMTEAVLSDGATEAGAVLVSAVNQVDGHSMAMLVARMPAEFSPRSCFIGQAPYRIEWSGTPDPGIILP